MKVGNSICLARTVVAFGFSKPKEFTKVQTYVYKRDQSLIISGHELFIVVSFTDEKTSSKFINQRECLRVSLFVHVYENMQIFDLILSLHELHKFHVVHIPIPIFVSNLLKK